MCRKYTRDCVNTTSVAFVLNDRDCGQHLVRRSGQAREHRETFFPIRRFTECHTVTYDQRVGAEHGQTSITLGGRCTSLFDSKPLYQCSDRFVGSARFIDCGHDDSELQTQLCE